ncbi:MAG: methyltransferase domain-containing protein [Alphaproteobacteria bacterium]|nr:methyltransferase domain-containing protein [Alphaproteobacteria bacterium]
MAEGLTEDRLLGGRVRLRQPRDGYRAAIDPVLLAAAVRARPGERVLDLGTGAGAAALCLMARVEDLTVVGLEVDPTTAALARENAALNGRDRFTVRDGDVTRLPAGLRGFDRAMVNPPFLEAGRADPPPDPGRRRAHVDADGLDAWVEAALKAVSPGGAVTFIQRADRLADLLTLLQGRAGGIVVAPLWPKAGEAAKRVIVEARAGVRTPLRLLPGLVLHAPDGRYTEPAEAILRGMAFDLGEISRGPGSA